MATPEMHSEESYARDSLVSLWPEVEAVLDKIYLVSCKTTDGFFQRPPAEIAASITHCGKKHIIFDHSAESVHIPLIKLIDSIYQLCNDPSIKFYFWTGAVTGQADYEKICNVHGLERNITILSSYFFEQRAADELSYNKPYTPGLKEKKFLCYNRVERHHRVELLMHMIRLDLIKDSYYSFDFTRPGTVEVLTDINDGKYDLLLDNLDVLPLTINRSPKETNPVQVWEEDYPYFEQSYISIVTETQFYKQLVVERPGIHLHTPSSVRGVFPSEKIYKPIGMRHPFIVVTGPGFLQALRDRGYRTFSPMINETYDTIDDDEERMLAIVDEIERIGKWSDTEWQDFTNYAKDIVEHNAQHLYSLTDFRVTKNIDGLFK